MLVFAAVARARGVRGAASALGTPRSTVSRRLAALEADLGAPLVVRTNRRFELTELGAALASRCERLEELLKDTDDFARRATDEPSGTLRIDAAPVLGEEVLPEIVDELLRRHPQLSVRVRLSADYTDLRRGAVDVALRAWSLEDATDLFATRLGSSTTGCWASPAYLEARGTPRAPKDLASHECILVGEATTGTWTFGAGARQERVEVGGRARSRSAAPACCARRVCSPSPSWRPARSSRSSSGTGRRPRCTPSTRAARRRRRRCARSSIWPARSSGASSRGPLSGA